MVELVVDRVDVSSEVREDGDLEVLVFEIDGAPGLRRALVAEVIEHRVGIDGMRIHQREGRIRIRWSELVGGDGDAAFPAARRLRMNREGKKQRKAMATKHAFARATGRRGDGGVGGLFGTVFGCKADFSESVELQPRARFIIGIQVGIQATTAAVLP